MKVDVKEVMADDGASISIESGDGFDVDDAKLVSITTNHAGKDNDVDELWVFKRKKFLKAVAKALNVVICDADDGDGLAGEAGYYK